MDYSTSLEIYEAQTLNVRACFLNQVREKQQDYEPTELASG
jgi:hypothetical protein